MTERTYAAAKPTRAVLVPAQSVRGDVLQPKLRISQSGVLCEREADQPADAVVRGERAVSRLRPMGASPAGEFNHDFGRVRASGGGCSPLQTKLTVNQPGDRYEQEADQVAGQVMGMSENDGSGNDAPLIAQSVPRWPGLPLDPSTRQFMEPRFGHDFSQVRIRRDTQSARTASSLGARAFTVGHTIGFASGQYAPERAAGKQLIAHELAHVVQQGGAPPLRGSPRPIRPTTTPVRVARTPQSGGSQPATARSSADFETLWNSFWFGMRGSATPETRQRARTVLQALLVTGSLQDKQTKGLQLALWFLDRGMTAEATEALSSVEGAWTIGAAIEGGSVPLATHTTASTDDVTSLIQRAERAARTDRHSQAFRLFGLAFLFLQMQLVQATERRAEELRGGNPAVASMTRAYFVYPTVGLIYDRMRQILGFYLELERQATAAGQTSRAAQYAGLASRLQEHVRENFMWGGEAMIAEVSRVQTRIGPSIRLHGANLEETDLTPFQGLPTPEEIGGRSYQWQSLEGIVESLSAQVQFLGELNRQPEIRRAFAGRSIDMNSLSHRLQVWRAMYSVFLQQGSGTDALGELMALIGRYLRAFTIHTQYNIRDWGQNYLTSDLPVDLAGRAERDCGVYALTVAYEVFRTARSTQPRLNLEFELTVVPGHVVLVIYDLDNNSFFVVNNDRIGPRQTGGRPEAEAAVAPAAGGVFGRRNFVTPGIRMSIGSTRLSTGSFRRQAWERYREASGWSLAPEPRGPGDTRSQGELNEAGARRFYERQRHFDQQTRQLGNVLNGLRTELANLTAGEQRSRLQSQLPPLTAAAQQLQSLLTVLGPGAGIQVDVARPYLVGRLRPLRRFLFSWQPEGSAHPLARVAMALLRFEHLGGTLSNQERAFIAWCDTIGALHDDLQRYRQSGFPAGF